VSQIETYCNKKITKFVITGGPGAGKSTALEQNIELPPFITVLKEVTDDSAFKDYSLAKRIPEII